MAFGVKPWWPSRGHRTVPFEIDGVPMVWKAPVDLPEPSPDPSWEEIIHEPDADLFWDWVAPRREGRR